MIVANFTDESLTWTHEGVTGIIEAGKVVEMPENRARFILNKLGMRGLVQLEYSEDPKYKERKKKESRELNDRFWVKQVEYHNRHNETLKAANKSYVRPTDVIMKAAEKFGLELLGPWKIKQVAVKVEGEEVAIEVGELKTQVAQLTTLVTQLLANQTKVATPIYPAMAVETDPNPEDAEAGPDADIDPDTPVFNYEFKSLPKKQLDPWIRNNIKEIIDWPAEALAALDERYKKLFDKPLDLKQYGG